jgi:hypothetical protein
VRVYVFNRKELQVSVRLTRPAVLARVEEGKQALLLAATSVLPCLQASVRRLEIILLQRMCLLLVGIGGENEVLGDYWELVQDQQVAWVGRGDVGDVECCWRVLEGIGFLLRCRAIVLVRRFLRERRAVSQLEL